MRILLTILVAAVLSISTSAQTITKIYIPAGAGGEVGHAATLVYAVETGQLINQLQPAHDAAVAVATPDSSQVWLFDASGTSCDIFSTVTDQLVKSLDVQRQVTGALFSPDGRYCFIIGAVPGGQTDLSVIDRASSNVVSTLSQIVGPTAGAVTSDSKTLYCASAQQGTVTKIDIASFKTVTTIAVGFGPSALTLTPDNGRLFVVCRGLGGGKRGGSQITVVDTRTDKPFWVLNLGQGCSSIAFTPDGLKMAVTFDQISLGSAENVRVFNLFVSDDTVTVSRIAGFSLGQAPQSGMVVSGGRYWIGCDPTAGGVPIVDLSPDTAVATYSSVGNPHPLQVAAVTIHTREAIAAINSKISSETDSSKVPGYYLDLAYLFRTANRKNDMVAAYQKVIGEYPNSFAAVSAGLQMGDVCYNDQLYLQSADYAFNALNAYRDYLEGGTSTDRLSENLILTAVDRLALFSKNFNKEYLKDLADSYLKLSAKSPELAESFFRMGYDLRQGGENKLAGRCFSQSENQLAAIADSTAYQPLAARLTLATNDPRALYRIKEKKPEPTIDGDLAEWAKDKPMLFSGASGFRYGAAPWRGDDDLSGKIYFARTDTDLYVVGSIKDDSLVSLDDATGDMVAVFFDFRPTSGSYFSRDFAAGNGCFSLYIMAPTAANSKVRVQLGIQTPYEIASIRTEAGYTFELKLPLATFSGWLTKETKRFGLGVELVDYDNPGDSKLAKAIGFLIPSEGVAGPPRPELYGIAEF